jgi:hypothetical protein
MWSRVILLEEGSFVAICKRNCYRLQNFLDVSLCSHGALDEYQRRSTSVTHRAPNHNASNASYVAHHKKLKITPFTASSPNPLPTITMSQQNRDSSEKTIVFLSMSQRSRVRHQSSRCRLFYSCRPKLNKFTYHC